MTNIKNEYGQIIVDIFKKYDSELFFKDYCKKPFYIGEVENNDLLFIGLTPSYNVNDLNKEFFTLKQEGNDYPYYHRFEKIHNQLKIRWDYWDMLFIRETKQDKIKQLCGTGLSFIWEQLQVSKKVINSLNPKVIVVCNTLVRTFLGKDKAEETNNNTWLGYRFEFDDTIGTFRIKDLNNTPIFFTSMLTGQRALDNGSYERLLWHLQFVLNRI